MFEFGGNNLNDNVNGRPFFSRNIGLVNGLPVDIVAGGKLSGQLGELGIGGARRRHRRHRRPATVRSCRPRAHAAGVRRIGSSASSSRTAIRRARPRTRSRAATSSTAIRPGSPATRSRPTSSTSAAFRASTATTTRSACSSRYPNEPFSTRFQFKEVGENFDPALGFVNRPGIRYYDGNFYYIARGRRIPGFAGSRPAPGTISSPTSTTGWSRARTAPGSAAS